jgi:superfamily II DNA or RNA helicase
MGGVKKDNPENTTINEPKKLTFKPKNKPIQDTPSDQENPPPQPNLPLEPILPSQPKIMMVKQLKVGKPEGPIQFGKDGLPLPTRENLDRMSMEEVEKFCDIWTADRHLNALIVELADYVTVAQSKQKSEKCQAIMKYKKTYPSGSTRLAISESYDKTYESFNWRPDSTIKFGKNMWTLPNSTNFRAAITDMFANLRLTDAEIALNRTNPNDPQSEFKYQTLVSEYLDPLTPYRSLLAYHGLGSGKSRSAVIASTRFLENGMKVVVMTPGALREKFIQELFLWGSQKHGVGIENYKNLSDTDRMAKEKVARKAIAYYYDILTYNEKGIYDKLKALINPETGYLENRLVIIDEIHNLVSRMAKVTNISRQVYHFLMERLNNCKLLFLSGTPLLNNAYELGILFNVLRGRFMTKVGTFPLFPENDEDFNEKFVNIYDKSVTNSQMFKRRINGLVSYYAGTTDRKGMPEEIKNPTQMLPMSNHQFKLYMQERFNETRKERKGKVGTTKNVDESTGSAFRTYSRMVCNFSFPDGIPRPKPISARDFKTYEKYQDIRLDPSQLDLEDVIDEIDPSQLESFSKRSKDKDQSKDQSKDKDKEKSKNPTDILDDEDDDTDLLSGEERTLSKKQREETYAKLLTQALINLEAMKSHIFSPEALATYSPKMLAIMTNILTAPGKDGLVYIYTEFRILEGVRIMGSILQYNGFEKINYTGINSFDDFKAKNAPGVLRYGIISSEEDSKQRRLILEIFNHPENAHGEWLKVIMGTSASSEGIDLMRTSQIHIMEPYWNMVRNSQVIGRGVRFGSHLDLPIEEQKVYIYSYQMVLTDEQSKQIIEFLDNPKEKMSTDQHIHNLALMKDQINSQFLKMIKESSVDCALNYMVNIKKDPDLRCINLPTEANKYMYLPDINMDPEDQVYLKNLKYEDYKISMLTIEKEKYGYKVNSANGRPIMDPPYITYQGKIYHQIITLYDPNLLENGIEVKRKYYVVGTKILIDP